MAQRILSTLRKCCLSKDISELFASNSKSSTEPKFILIERAPGIGKTILCKEICLSVGQPKTIETENVHFLDLFA